MALPLGALILVLTGLSVWLGATFPQLVALTIDISSWCGNIFTFCMGYSPVIGAALMWCATAVGTGGIVYAAIRAGREFLAARRAFNGLPVAETVKSVALIRDDAVKAAFTYGLLRPRVYVSTGLIKSLEREELMAVVLHEAHHRRHRDPLRYFLLAFIKDAFFYLPIGKYLASRIYARGEIAADDYAVKKTKDPLGLAGALVKVAGSLGADPVCASIKGGGRIEERVRRLIEDGRITRPRPPMKVVLSSIVVSMVLLFGLTASFSASFNTTGKCSMEHCSMHAGSMDENCAAHCRASNHGGDAQTSMHRTHAID